jgi:5-methylcytosine-specific restriction endonuclease McrA
MTWVQRLRKLAKVTGISLELVKFDVQAMQNPEISGILYQQGELAGYEMREYLLEKFNRTCVYCGAKNVPLQVEHIIPKAKSGSNRISNLTLACDACNKAKGTLSLEEFLSGKPALLKKIKAQLKTPLKDAAAVNATRWELWRQLAALNLPVQCGSGALTKFNRTKQGLPKAHWLDAACVGKDTPTLKLNKISPLYIKSYGRGTRQVWQTDSFGFPRRPKAKEKTKFGFCTGDWAKAIVPKGKLQGTHIGRLTTRATPIFTVGNADGINPKHIMLLQRNDGYEYSYTK